MKRAHAVAVALSLALTTTGAYAAPSRDEVQLPRSTDEVQAPRDRQDEVQAPRNQDEVQAPRDQQDEVQSPRGQDNAGNAFERKLDKQGLLDFVHQRQNENPDQPVVIAADRSVKYEAVLDVMSVLKADGVKRVGLMVKSKTS